MAYSLSDAAKAAGRSKPAILNAIKSGKISAQKDEFGCWRIEPAELHRVYAPVNTSGKVSEVVSNPLSNPNKTATLRAELEGLKAQLELLKNEHEDLRSDRDRWRNQATALLEDKRGEQAGVAVKIWRSLFRKG